MVKENRPYKPWDFFEFLEDDNAPNLNHVRYSVWSFNCTVTMISLIFLVAFSESSAGSFLRPWLPKAYAVLNTESAALFGKGQ